MSCGFIYLLANSSLLTSSIKIGRTDSDPQGRESELQTGAGLTPAFKLAYAEATWDPETAEARIREKLAGKQSAKGDDLYTLPLPDAQQIVHSVIADIRAQSPACATCDERKSSEQKATESERKYQAEIKRLQAIIKMMEDRLKEGEIYLGRPKWQHYIIRYMFKPIIVLLRSIIDGVLGIFKKALGYISQNLPDRFERVLVVSFVCFLVGLVTFLAGTIAPRKMLLAITSIAMVAGIVQYILSLPKDKE